jgi:hypothetical protein
LTPTPIETRHREFAGIGILGELFRFIDVNIGILLKKDSHTTTLREYLVAFNTPMYELVGLIEEGLSHARVSYTHNDDELVGRNLDPEITEAQAQILLDKKFQKQVVKYAKLAAARFQSAAKTLAEVAIPRLPDLQTEIHQYIREYHVRYEEMCWRKKVWLPNVLLNFIFGSYDPVPRDFASVANMPEDIDQFKKRLPELVSFLEGMASHFLQLSELSMNDIVSLGYSKPEDLRRLYRDRLICSQLLRDMHNINIPFTRTFSTGRPRLSDIIRDISDYCRTYTSSLGVPNRV